MKSYHFSALKFMTSVCLLLFVSLTATRLQAQYTHTITFALWEVDDPGEPSFALYNLFTKQYLFINDKNKVEFSPTSNFPCRLDNLKDKDGAYQVESKENYSIACCTGSYNEIYVELLRTLKDDLIFEEVKSAKYPKDVFRIKFRDDGRWLTSTGTGHKVYGSHEELGDLQLWMITGR